MGCWRRCCSRWRARPVPKVWPAPLGTYIYDQQRITITANTVIFAREDTKWVYEETYTQSYKFPDFLQLRGEGGILEFFELEGDIVLFDWKEDPTNSKFRNKKFTRLEG